jgi:predicted ATP-grasp superfamily ATP-dependent carboligase
MNWADLFERAEEYETDVETIREALAARREGGAERAEPTEGQEDA